MNCLIPADNLRILGKALQALSKIGDELFIVGKVEGLQLITLNMSKTICARFKLLNSFFSSFDIANAENDPSCKVHMKVILPLFKGPIEKLFDYFKIQYESNSDIIKITMKYARNDIMIVHQLRLLEDGNNETLAIQISTDSGSNNICASSAFFNQLLTMFGINDMEITLQCTKEMVVARNYCVGAPPHGKSVRSEIKLNPSEFSRFSVTKDSTINFPLRPLRTAIVFADNFDLNMGFNFDSGGVPMSIIMKNPTFEVNFIVATLDPQAEMQSSMAPTSFNQSIVRIERHKTTEESEINENNNNSICTEENEDDLQIRKKARLNTKTTVSAANPFKNISKSKSVVESVVNKCLTESEKENVPDKPLSDLARIVFNRAFEPSLNEQFIGDVIAGNSDSE